MAYDPQPKKRRPILAMGLLILGSIAMSTTVAIVLALVLALLFWQLMANVFAVAFVQELRWYGPSVYTAGGDLWWWVTGVGIAGAVVTGLGVYGMLRAEAEIPRPFRRRRA